MAVQLVDSYFLKALDSYPYDMDATVEALNYALSYDENHSGALCLMGQIAMERLHRYDEAEDYYERALSADTNYAEIYPHYADLLLKLRDFKRALKLIDFSYSVKGICLNGMRHRKALALEALGKFKAAKSVMKEAVKDCFYDNDIEFYQTEIKRIKKKIESSKKRKLKHGN